MIIDLEQAVAELSANILGRINVCLPGVVASYDHGARKASVRPAIRSFYIDEDTESRMSERMPVIPNVPVLSVMYGSTFAVDAPLAVGDHVLLLFCDRSIDEYEQTGQDDNTPQDPRRFDLSDAVALPVQLRPSSAPVSQLVVDATGAVELHGAAASLRLGATGTARLGSVAADLTDLTGAVADALDALCTALGTFTAALTVESSAGAGLSAALVPIVASLTATRALLTSITE